VTVRETANEPARRIDEVGRLNPPQHCITVRITTFKEAHP
jgi:hypothetical protein